MAILPKPLRIQSDVTSAALEVAQAPLVSLDPTLDEVALYLARELARQLGGAPAPVVSCSTSHQEPSVSGPLSGIQPVGARGARVELRLDPQVAHAEGYRVSVADGVATLSGRCPAGVFYAAQSFLALAKQGAGRVGALELEDAPRFRWRGAHLDVGRHFFSVEFIKRFIDLMALHKLNVFHWHLTEDQGWRVAIDAYPRLTEVGSMRGADGAAHGGYYTKAEVREVVAYAASRFIEVVPEIEMPGHAVAALAAYPELSCTGGPFAVETKWGIFEDVFCAGKAEVFQFLETVLDEVIELFPSPFFHIGADECPKKRWKECPDCQARLKAEGLSDEDELQSWFVSKMSRFLESRGKRLVGWDEILEGGLAAGATVMSWRGTQGGVQAARMGHDVIMSPTSHCYLDYRQAEGADEPGAWFAAPLSLEQAYSYEPVPAELEPEQAKHVLGVQGNLWTERMPTPSQVEYMSFPRLCALAEVAWSGGERDFAEFSERLAAHLTLLDAWQVGYRGSPLARPIRPSADEPRPVESPGATAYA